jgi:hypothetical protein
MPLSRLLTESKNKYGLPVQKGKPLKSGPLACLTDLKSMRSYDFFRCLVCLFLSLNVAYYSERCACYCCIPDLQEAEPLKCKCGCNSCRKRKHNRLELYASELPPELAECVRYRNNLVCQCYRCCQRLNAIIILLGHGKRPNCHKIKN